MIDWLISSGHGRAFDVAPAGGLVGRSDVRGGLSLDAPHLYRHAAHRLQQTPRMVRRVFPQNKHQIGPFCVVFLFFQRNWTGLKRVARSFSSTERLPSFYWGFILWNGRAGSTIRRCATRWRAWCCCGSTTTSPTSKRIRRWWTSSRRLSRCWNSPRCSATYVLIVLLVFFNLVWLDFQFTLRHFSFVSLIAQLCSFGLNLT